MGKIKIYEIAKKLNLASKEVVEMAGKLNIEVKNHMSAVSEEDAEKIANKFNSKTEKEAKKREKTNKVEEESKKEKKTTKTEPKNPKKEEKAPVIIRREVLIEEKGKEEVKKQNKTNNVGFVERKQNKDFNIVYRNKPNKPLTDRWNRSNRYSGLATGRRAATRWGRNGRLKCFWHVTAR